ncbi:MAG: polysaccharide deacetylase family protein [Ignavibacteriaceae bacterium]
MKTYFFALLILIATPANFFASSFNLKGNKTNQGVKKTTSAYGTVSVKTWADDRKAAFSFTLDDGLMSQYTYALPILDQYGFHATFNLIAGSLVDSGSAIYRYGYWWQFKQIAAEGHEIGAHTMTHQDLTTLPIGDENTPGTLTYELAQSQKIIQQKIPGQKVLTLAYPFCAYNSMVENVASKYFIAARTCGDYTQSPTITGTDWYNILSANIVFDMPRNSTADDQDELNMYTNILQNNTIPNGQWSVFLAHEVVPMSEITADGDTTMWYPVSTDWFNQLCAWLKPKSDDKEIWVETFGNVSRYIKERENFSYDVVSASNTQLELSTGTGLDTSIYNYPLTVDITVPSNWNVVSITQGDKVSEAISFFNGTDNVVRTYIIPGEENVILSANASLSLSGQVTYDNTANTPLPNAKIVLSGPGGIDSTVTDVNGQYIFTNLVSGNYSIAVTKTDNWGGVNSTDALMVARIYANLVSIDALQKKAADVNVSGSINSTDALLISRRFVHLIQSFPQPDWLFSNPDSIAISNSSIVQNIQGIATGDVNKSYQP